MTIRNTLNGLREDLGTLHHNALARKSHAEKELADANAEVDRLEKQLEAVTHLRDKQEPK